VAAPEITAAIRPLRELRKPGTVRFKNRAESEPTLMPGVLEKSVTAKARAEKQQRMKQNAAPLPPGAKHDYANPGEWKSTNLPWRVERA
jgi:hypothetical protein